MITPLFSIDQDGEFLTIVIQAPHCNISLADIFIEGTDFKFFAKPYFLRLNLPGEIIEDDRSKCSYNFDKGEFLIKVAKVNGDEEFKDLDLLTKLLTPCKTKNKKPLIEVISDNQEELSNDDIEFYQSLPEVESPLLSKTFGYGFANEKFNIFTKLQGDPFEVLMVKEPDQKSVTDRRNEQTNLENSKFDSDYYLADLFDNSHIETLLSVKLSFNEKEKFTENEKKVLSQLPKKEYLLENSTIKIVCFSLVDILFAYCYNYRCTEGESNVESAWNIRTVSATLSCCASFKSLKEVLRTCYRRTLCYPLYRNFNLAAACQTDVINILKPGKIKIMKILLEIHDLFHQNEQFYLLNELYVTDYTVWMQYVNDDVFHSLSEAVKEINISKADVDLEIDVLEQAALLVLDAEDSSSDSESSDSTSNSSCSDSDEDKEELCLIKELEDVTISDSKENLSINSVTKTNNLQ